MYTNLTILPTLCHQYYCLFGSLNLDSLQSTLEHSGSYLRGWHQLFMGCILCTGPQRAEGVAICNAGWEGVLMENTSVLSELWISAPLMSCLHWEECKHTASIQPLLILQRLVKWVNLKIIMRGSLHVGSSRPPSCPKKTNRFSHSSHNVDNSVVSQLSTTQIQWWTLK